MSWKPKARERLKALRRAGPEDEVESLTIGDVAEASPSWRERLEAVALAYDPCSREFSRQLTTLAVSLDDAALADMEQALAAPGDLRVRYAIFYTLNVVYRRMRHFRGVAQLMARYREEFSSVPHLALLLSLHHRQQGTQADMQQALEYARAAVRACPDNAGALHNLAEVVASLLEARAALDPDLLAEAWRAVEEALAQDPYPKFFCTKGRLAAQKGRFDEAERLIQRAIELEDMHERDYALRIGEYQSYLLSLSVERVQREIRSELASAHEDVQQVRAEVARLTRESQATHLQFLGFFTALLSFIVGSLSLLSHQTLASAARLLLLLGGIELTVMLGFTLVLGRIAFLAPRWLAAFGVAIALMVEGILYVH